MERYLARALDEIVTPPAAYGGRGSGAGGGGGSGGSRGRERRDADGTVDYARWSRSEREEYGVVPLMETGVGREVRGWALKACKSAEVVGFWPSRAVGLGCVWMAVRGRGLGLGRMGDEGEWVGRVGGGKVDVGDWKEVVEILAGW